MKAAFTFSMFGIAILVASCSLSGHNKDPEPKDCNPFPAVNDLLMGKHWVETAETTIIVSGNDSTSSNSYPNMASCSRDDFMEFKPNSLLIADNGTNKCVPIVPQILEGTWCNSNNGKTLTFTFGNMSGDLEILSLTAQQMILQEIHTD